MVWVPADSGVAAFVDSWIEGVVRAGMSNYLVAATDDTLFDRLRERGRNVYRAEVAAEMAGKAGGRWALLLRGLALPVPKAQLWLAEDHGERRPQLEAYDGAPLRLK